MTQRGQWYDFTTKTGSCTVGFRGVDPPCNGLKTHVVKWHTPPTKWHESNRQGRLRHYVCAAHAAMITVYQKTLGAKACAYRYRKG